MPTPVQSRYNAPNRTPDSPTQHAQNILELERVIDQYPTFPTYVNKKPFASQDILSVATNDSYAKRRPFPTNIITYFEKELDYTGLLIELSATISSAGGAANALSDTSFTFKIRNRNTGAIWEPPDDGRYYLVYIRTINIIGTRWCQTGRVALHPTEQLPSGHYEIIPVAWTTTNNVKNDSGMPFKLSVTEQIPYPPYYTPGPK